MHHSGVHDATLVALSIVIAIVSSFTALDLASRMRTSSRRAQKAWLASAAVAMGGGIWSMHFVAMLAFSVPGMEVSYDLGLTLVSLALPIFVTAVGFMLASSEGGRRSGFVLGGMVMGAGIAAMHYTGMAAMQMPVEMQYEASWVALSLLVALGASIAGLWIARAETGIVQRGYSAVVLGLAIAGMHYVAMQGLSFSEHVHVRAGMDGYSSLGQTRLAMWVAGITFVIMLLSLAAAMIDRNHVAHAQQEAKALKSSEERFRLLVQSVTDYAMFVLDRSGDIAQWNLGAQRLIGLTEAEAVGRRYWSLEAEPDERSAWNLLGDAMTDGRTEFETNLRRNDGSTFWASVILEAMKDEAGNHVGFAMVVHDITERRKADESLEKARQALFQAQKMDAVGQLTGGVAHDFNNLLMVILGSLELMRKRLPEDERLLGHLDTALQGVQRGASLTQRMLAFARRQHLWPKPVSIYGLVKGMDELLNRSLAPGQAIVVDVPEDMAPAMVDPHQLELALLNLVVNARDAMPDGGTIRIEASERVGGAGIGLPPGRYVCLTVSDTGVGMGPETLSRALEPFFTTKGVGKGTGLGLAMVHGLAEQSHGRLVLKSELRKGTTAEIWLPVADAAHSTLNVSALPALVLDGVSLSILAVDDDPIVLTNCAAMLEDLGHTVAKADTGAEAISALRSGLKVDLVVTDQVMPGMTGVELARLIEAEFPGLPVIIATGYSDLPPGTKIPKLDKPFSQAALGAAVLGAVRRGRASATAA